MIAEDLQYYCVETIKTVLPEYYSTIKPDITTLNDEITKFRNDKDVANIRGDHLIRYIKEIKRIVEHHKKITMAIPELNEVEKKLAAEREEVEKKLAAERKEVEKKLAAERKKNEIYDWAKRITVGAIIFFLGWGVNHIQTVQSSSNPSLSSAQQENVR